MISYDGGRNHAIREGEFSQRGLELPVNLFTFFSVPMKTINQTALPDTGERMIPTADGELSYVFARHKFAYECARGYAESRSVLDVGCGTGYGCKILSAVAQSVVGIDYHSDAIAFCRAHYSAPNVSFAQCDIPDIHFTGEFDLAVSFQVIEHLSDLHLFLGKLTTAVRPGGMILITTPNVRTPATGRDANPFHTNEMNYTRFHDLLSEHFASFELLGIGYASPNRLRAIVQGSPLYRLGKLFGRKSPMKKIADATMGLTKFRVLKSAVAESSIDLFAICRNDLQQKTKK